MGKKLAIYWDKYGYYAVMLLCLATVVFAAIITLREDALRAASQAAANTGERLDDAQASQVEPSAPPAYTLKNTLAAPFSDTPEHDVAHGVWRVHQSIDVLPDEKGQVYALRAGKVQSVDGDSVTILHEDDSIAVYRGFLAALIAQGTSIAQGEALGSAGAAIPFEGAGHVHITVYDAQGVPLNPF